MREKYPVTDQGCSFCNLLQKEWPLFQSIYSSLSDGLIIDPEIQILERPLAHSPLSTDQSKVGHRTVGFTISLISLKLSYIRTIEIVKFIMIF